MLHLARNYGRRPISVEEIATAEGISRKFLEAIMLDLTVDGLLLSSRGKGGGYMLHKAPARISIGKIIRAVEGRLVMGGNLGTSSATVGNTGGTLAVNLVMDEICRAVNRVVDEKSLEALQQELHALSPEGASEFHI